MNDSTVPEHTCSDGLGWECHEGDQYTLCSVAVPGDECQDPECNRYTGRCPCDCHQPRTSTDYLDRARRPLNADEAQTLAIAIQAQHERSGIRRPWRLMQQGRDAQRNE